MSHFPNAARITKISYKEKDGITVKFEDHKHLEWECKDKHNAPAPAFTDALQSLASHALKYLGIKLAQGATCEVRHVHFNHDAEEGFKWHASVYIARDGNGGSISMKPIDYNTSTKAEQDKLDELIEATTRLVAGERKQLHLWAAEKPTGTDG